MTDTEKIIEDIVQAFDMEIDSIESSNIKHEIWSNNPPDPTDAIKRQKRSGKEYEEQRDALRRVLRRKLIPNTKKIAEQASLTLEKELQTIAKKMEKAFSK